MVGPPITPYEHVLDRVERELVSHGFRRRRNKFYARREGNWGIVSVEPHRRNTGSDFDLTFGVYVSSWKLTSFYQPDASYTKTPTLDQFHWGGGIGHLIGGLGEKWWQIQAYAHVEDLAAEVVEALDQHGLAALQSRWTDEQLIQGGWVWRPGWKRTSEELIHLAVLECLYGKARLSETLAELNEALSRRQQTVLRNGVSVETVLERIRERCPGG